MAIWYDLLQACGTSAAAVANAPPVVVREELRGVVDDPVPFWIVAKGGPEEPVDYAFTNLVLYRYPILFVMVMDQERDWIPDQVELDLRQTLREQIDQRTLSTVSSVFDVDMEPLDLSGIHDAIRSTYRVTGFRANYFSWETRTN